MNIWGKKRQMSFLEADLIVWNGVVTIDGAQGSYVLFLWREGNNNEIMSYLRFCDY